MSLYSPSEPMRQAACTPSGADISFVAGPDNKPQINCREIFVGGTGDVRVATVDGTIVTYTIAVVPFILAGRFTKIFNTGTTATNLIRRW